MGRGVEGVGEWRYKTLPPGADASIVAEVAVLSSRERSLPSQDFSSFHRHHGEHVARGYFQHFWPYYSIILNNNILNIMVSVI